MRRRRSRTATYYDEYRIGGTSLASPLFAGMTALALQKARAGARPAQPGDLRSTSAGRSPTSRAPRRTPGNVRVDYANGVDASDGLLYSVRTFDQDTSLTGARARTR